MNRFPVNAGSVKSVIVFVNRESERKGRDSPVLEF